MSRVCRSCSEIFTEEQIERGQIISERGSLVVRIGGIGKRGDRGGRIHEFSYQIKEQEDVTTEQETAFEGDTPQAFVSKSDGDGSVGAVEAGKTKSEGESQ